MRSCCGWPIGGRDLHAGNYLRAGRPHPARGRRSAPRGAAAEPPTHQSRRIAVANHHDRAKVPPFRPDKHHAAKAGLAPRRGAAAKRNRSGSVATHRRSLRFVRRRDPAAHGHRQPRTGRRIHRKRIYLRTLRSRRSQRNHDPGRVAKLSPSHDGYRAVARF